MKVVLHSDDINLLTYWQKAVDQECQTVDTLEELEKFSDSLIVFNFSACKPFCEELINKLTVNNNTLLMLDRTPTLETAKFCLQLGVMGYGNAFMKEHFLNAALDTITEGMVWLYPELTSELIKGLGTAVPKSNDSLLEKLTDREREVALLLKDGATYNQIAESLSITPRTVKAHAMNCYTKLGVRDRIGLALLFK